MAVFPGTPFSVPRGTTRGPRPRAAPETSAFLAVLAAVLVAAIGYESSAAWLFGFILVCLAGIGAGESIRRLRRVAVDVHAPEPLRAGDTAQLTIPVRDGTAPERTIAATPIDARGRWLGTATGVPDEGPLSLAVACPVRGVFSIGRLRLADAGPLGLLPFVAAKPVSAELIVWPRARRHASVPEDPAPDASEAGYLFEGHRRYRPGDPLHRVDWKASARVERPLVKVFAGQPRAPRVFAHDELPGLDPEARLEHLAWLVDRAASASEAFGLRLPSGEIPMSAGERHRRRCLTALAREPAGGRP